MSRTLVLASAMLLASPAVMAHPADGSGFSAGLIHAFTGFDHMLSMLAIGLWSAGLMKRSRQLILWGLPMVLAAGFAIGSLIGVEQVIATADMSIALSLVLLGGLIATRVSGLLNNSQALLLALAFVIFHGVAHTEAQTGHALAFLAGLMLTSIALSQLGNLIGQQLAQRSPRLLAVAGSVISLCGLSLALA
ncbi:HupE/UreJ family protein [Oceanobacter mangrovi]|uniref:HupE/UreJ family protein n=1 Tax=Oceanobacter mangrovi TaxID=2862510 RepID=UPI001C8EEB04|nr:HupE/UreJ family protein [Oceanobacter mangrovi]